MQRLVSNIDELRKALPGKMQTCLAFFPRVDRSVGGYERLVQKELRRTLLKYKLQTDQELFDKAYGYIRQYY